MQPAPHSAGDISYAHSASSPAGRALIRLMENASGRLGLIRRASGYDRDVAEGRDFWSVMMDRFGLTLDLAAGRLDLIPRDRPVILIANHPFGILDGLVLGHVLAQSRGDFRILAHQVFHRAGDLGQAILPVSFDETPAAVQANLATRRAALDYLAEGGAIGIFPGGTVSTGIHPFAAPMDPKWRSFTARMVSRSRAVVVPLYFEGHNSRLFQLASHLHMTLRMGLLIREFRARVDQPVRLAIGAPIDRDVLDPLSRDPVALMDVLRRATYRLSPDLQGNALYGHEFEPKHRRGAGAQQT